MIYGFVVCAFLLHNLRADLAMAVTVATNVSSQWTVKFTTVCTMFARRILKEIKIGLQFVEGLLFILVACAPITFL